MKKRSIKIQNGNCFSYDDVKSEWMQKLLKEAYIHSEKSRASCCCHGDNEKLELVIAYRRKSELFELRKMPGQSSKLHAESCFFARESNQESSTSHSKSFFITMPSKENEYFADHGALKKLQSYLVKVIRSEIEIKSWYHIKSELLDLSKRLVVNDDFLSKSFNILIPTSKENIKPIWFKGEEPRILFGELLYSRNVPQHDSIAIHLKGTGDIVWFNHSEFSESDSKALDLDNPDKRVFVMCSVLKSNSGNSIQGYGLSTKVLNKDFS
jgi:hypothetical protein